MGNQEAINYLLKMRTSEQNLVACMNNVLEPIEGIPFEAGQEEVFRSCKATALARIEWIDVRIAALRETAQGGQAQEKGE